MHNKFVYNDQAEIYFNKNDQHVVWTTSNANVLLQ